jgi:outer membrane protein assembly factor BamB
MTGTTTGNGSSGSGEAYRFYLGDVARTGHFPDRETHAEAISRSWEVTGESYSTPAPAVADGRAFVAENDGAVYAVDIATQSVEWREEITTSDRAPAVVDGTVYVPGEETLYALAAESGSVQWEYGMGMFDVRSPAVVDGTVYMTVRNRLRAFE